MLREILDTIYDGGDYTITLKEVDNGKFNKDLYTHIKYNKNVIGQNKIIEIPNDIKNEKLFITWYTKIEFANNADEIISTVDYMKEYLEHIGIEKEERELNMEKYCLNDLLGNVHFDVNDLSELWEEDNGDYYTTDQEEAEWIKKFADGVRFVEENNIDDSHFEYNDYAELIEVLAFEYLTAVYYDKENHSYELEFNNSWIVTVSASNHEEASTDEDYWDNEANVNKAIQEVKNQ